MAKKKRGMRGRKKRQGNSEVPGAASQPGDVQNAPLNPSATSKSTATATVTNTAGRPGPQSPDKETRKQDVGQNLAHHHDQQPWVRTQAQQPQSGSSPLPLPLPLSPNAGQPPQLISLSTEEPVHSPPQFLQEDWTSVLVPVPTWKGAPSSSAAPPQIEVTPASPILDSSLPQLPQLLQLPPLPPLPPVPPQARRQSHDLSQCLVLDRPRSNRPSASYFPVTPSQTSSQQPQGEQPLPKTEPKVKMANQNPRIQQVAPDKYLGEPPAHLDLLMLYIDTRADGFTLLDATYAADRKRLDQVRTSCRVWIDEPEGDEVTHLILRAEKTNHLKDGFNAIWTLMRRGDDVQGKNAYLVHPPNPGAQYRAIIVLNPNPDGTFRAVAVDPATFVELEDENGQAKATEAATDSAAVAATDADPGISIQSFYRDSFRKHFDLIAKTLRNDPDGIRMRVHFGILNLKERPRKVNSWSFEKFEDLIQVIGKRATGRFDLNVGNDGTGRAVLDAVVRSPDRFEGLLSTELELKDVSPKYFLVIVASDWLLEIEVEPQPGSKSRMCQTRAYLIGSQNRHTEVRVSCPERKLDWNLEVLAEANTKSIPKAILDFRDRMVLGAIAGKDGRFPKPIFDGQLAKAANIDMIMGKAVFTYQMVSRPYRLEVSIRSTCRTVNGHLSSEKSPIKSCAVSMTGTWWDDELVPAQVLYRKRLWGSDHARLFPCPDEGGGDGFEVFGECVEMVHDLIEDAPGAGAAVS